MIQLLPQNDALQLREVTPEAAVEFISDFIKHNSCKNMSVDISFMNVLDASYVSTLCSTVHYIKYPDGKINWKISSDFIRELNESLSLGNTNYEI